MAYTNSFSKEVKRIWKHHLDVKQKKLNEVKMAENKKPELKYRIGNISAAVWKNEGEKNGEKFETFSITLQRGYKDGKGEWQNTNSLQMNDIQKVISLLQKIQSDKIVLD